MLKSFITGCIIVTLCVLMLFVVLSDILPATKPLAITDSVQTLFTNACTAVLTYYFTRKDKDSTHKADG